MKVGDCVRVKEAHWAQTGQIGIIIEELFPDSRKNKGKAFRILFEGNKIRPKLQKQLELINESR